ncbi:hypothetical protein H0I76_03435 [Limibaculum sp. M0105]|uniref:Peptidase C45 hydrolase domain-containing protein n=1 Tax=Thermohalobaculum xanthum TaxID=2753746 RepID=A0A8J7M4F4_9RHOB|nr:C45 family peptidase [Thermohalobaculum xanthum]MBK0398231.1 hypothetical protein [Thermohalobaculum xanthum]
MSEDKPGLAWKDVFERGWPGWRRWFLSRGGDSQPTRNAAERALRQHMPDFEPLWHALVTTARADADAARFLSFWRPPRYLVGCSQAAFIDERGPGLIRNYDLDPGLNETTMLHSRWRGRRVMGMVDGMAGLADGMNDAGLAVSLAFGGRVVAGRGFGIPIIVRYILETCSSVDEAVEVLRAVPSHMSYNVTLIDRSGASATVFVAPDRPTILRTTPYATNHQLGVEWPQHGRISRTLLRSEHLENLFNRKVLSGAGLMQEFRQKPLFSTGYASGFGTVYTVLYRPLEGTATLIWSTESEHSWSIDHFVPAEITAVYDQNGSWLRATGPRGIDAPPTLAGPQDVPRTPHADIGIYKS